MVARRSYKSQSVPEKANIQIFVARKDYVKEIERPERASSNAMYEIDDGTGSEGGCSWSVHIVPHLHKI